MPGLMPGIHVLAAIKQEGRVWRDELNHDEKHRASSFFVARFLVKLHLQQSTARSCVQLAL
jgi:hypothetical protein